MAPLFISENATCIAGIRLGYYNPFRLRTRALNSEERNLAG